MLYKKKGIKRIRRLARLNVTVAILLAFAILLVSNYCASLLYVYWTYDTRAHGKLTERTHEFIQRSQGQIRITAIFERSHPFNSAVRHLLREYAEAAALVPGLTVETVMIDANHDLAAASELLKNFPIDVNAILLEYGHQYRIVEEHDMIHTVTGNNWSDEIADKHITLRFSGEHACTTALSTLLNPTPASVYFVQGHGEYDPDDHHQITGASTVAQTLTLSGFTVQKLNLLETRNVPSDCDVLFIAGPRTTFAPREIEVLSTFLATGGNAMILIDNTDASGLTTTIANWGLQLSPSDRSTRSAHPVSTRTYGTHPVTRRLNNIATFYSNPCFVDQIPNKQSGAERADKPLTSQLVLVPSNQTDNDAFDRTILRPIASASELGGAMLTGRRFNTRLVVFGDSAFISNAMNQPGYSGNKTLLLGAMEWLVGRQLLPATPEDSLPILHAGIDPLHGWTRLGITTGLALPLSIFLFGILVYLPAIRKL